ncbi:MAG: SDR family oxidoreductase [Lachnospiraceae bacterium]|nr:SDR family oxidoreductase [Lachnospiraceae bacterium]MBR1851650.1 SDR family oxidoreductase [Lachnospiraceae bacterium]
MTGKVKEASEIFGHIDILVNAAGTNSHKDFLEVTEDEYDAVMNVNAKGTFFMSQAIAKYMIENNIKGHILNITSSSALRPAKTPYHMSKWAVRGLTLGTADRLLSHGIIVNALAPGPVATEMLGKQEEDSIYKEGQPSGRYAMPQEIANMAVMLVSEMGNIVVGDTLYATGGSGVISLHN